MKKNIITALMAMLMTCLGVSATSKADSITVKLQNANKDVTYKANLIVDGKTVTLKNKTLTAKDGNVIAALVVNGGKLILDNCTIKKEGDGVVTREGKGNKGMKPQDGAMMMTNGERPPMPPSGGGMPPKGPDGKGGPGMGKKMPGNGGPGMGGPNGGDDAFNFYGTNSAVVAVGKESAIEMINCKVVTNAEYANAVFAADNATVNITDGININTTKGSSRGLFATTNGVINATGVVNISTQGAHCAALATDRGGGSVTLGSPCTNDVSMLNTKGEGSPVIYSTGNITAYNATGDAATSQTMVIEGKNTINIDNCSFSGNSPKHGGIMLYQSMSGDAEVGTSTLNMTNSTIKNNSDNAMILVTNTHTVVNMSNTRLQDKAGNELTENSALITCKNCNGDGRTWGKEGSNGGQIEVNLKGQTIAGIVLANESESKITINADKDSDISKLKKASGKGSVKL